MFKEQFLKSCLAIDTETTGKDYKTAEVIQLGTASVNGTVSKYYSASIPIPFEVSALTHIPQYFVDGNPLMNRDNLISELPNNYKNMYFIAHNSFYDQKVLERYGLDENLNWICTLRLAKKLWPESNLHNLPFLRYFLNVDVSPDLISHRADVDALVTFKVLEIMINKLEELNLLDTNADYGTQIIEIMKKPIITETMLFGKHKGKKLVDIPLSYWQWALENMESLKEDEEQFDPDFAASVELAVSKILGVE
jgi:exodeoxyribonuclease X